MAAVIVIGGANVDVKGRSSAPVIQGTSNPGEVVTAVGGVGRNIAHNLAALGVDVALIAAIGNDANGEMVRRETAAAGVDVTMLETVAATTGLYLVLLDDKGELIAAINDMRCVDLLRPAHLEARRTALTAAELLVADCNLSTACLWWLMDFARAAGKRLVIEPVSVPKALKLLEPGGRPAAYLITPNTAQLEALGHSADPQQALASLHGMGFANVVEHRGRDGACVFASDGAVAMIPALAVSGIRDVTGAGDAAVAGLVCGLVEGLDLVAAARLGQAAAALKLASAESIATGLSRDSLRALCA
jgi:pseudouridine kinase